MRSGNRLLAVGACGYYSDLFIYDQWGLTNSEVATAEVERRAGSAGHDRGVPPSFFLRHRPTYSDAKIVEPDEVEALERNALQRDPPSRVESHPLGEEEGGGVLVLFRILYAGEGVDEPGH